MEMAVPIDAALDEQSLLPQPLFRTHKFTIGVPHIH